MNSVSSAIDKRRYRIVDLTTPTRGCLFCLSPDGRFEGEEHAIPAAFGHSNNPIAIPPGAVCDDCNHFLGRQIDSAFVDRFDIRLTRALEGARGRGGVISMIEGRPPHTALLDVQVGDGTVQIHAAKVEEDGEGVIFDIRPKNREPQDIVSRSIRALWKMALGVIWLRDPGQAMSSQWDPVRCAILGYRFSGYLLARPFVAIRTGRLDLAVVPRQPQSPLAVHFRYGGVELAVPLLPGASLQRSEIDAAGWEVQRTDQRPPAVIRLQLDPEG